MNWLKTKKMVNKNCGVESFKTKLIVTVFGLLMILLGFNLGGIMIKFGFTDITMIVVSIITLVAIVLEYVALGVTFDRPIMTIKKFNNQQKITFAIASIVGFYAVFSLFGSSEMSSFTSGQLIVIGFLTVLDTWS
jgi:hypothetical protein